MTATTLWWLTLAGGLVVVAVVAALLAAIVASARRIKATLGEVWTVGQAIANNTAHLDLLRRINLAASDVVASVRLTAEQTRGTGAPGGER
jgi:hypothetical protein